MELTEEQLNFLTRLNLQGPLTSDFLGDRLKSKNCDAVAEEWCKLMKDEGYIYNTGYGYGITEKGIILVKTRTIFKR